MKTTWTQIGQSAIWTANHYGNEVEVWLDENGLGWRWQCKWDGGSDMGWADTMDEAKAEATR